MSVLVAYATRHGATEGIAEHIASRLRSAGVPAQARHVEDVDDIEPYDAVVMGSAAYMFHWLRDATAFARKHAQALQARPVWLFSSGPLGADQVDSEGQDVRESARPKEMDELRALLGAHEDRVFFGAWDPDARPVGFAEHIMRLMPAAQDALPAGDFRDWDDIDSWTDSIAADLRADQQREANH